MNAIAQFRVPGGEAADALVLRAAVEACPSGLAIIEDDLVLYANRAFAELFGYFHSSAVQGRALSEFLPEPQFPARPTGHDVPLETSAVFSLSPVQQLQRYEEKPPHERSKLPAPDSASPNGICWW